MKHYVLGALLCAFSAQAANFDIRQEAEFKKIIPATSEVRKLAGDFKFLEGPAWVPEGFLVFSDIPANEIKQWTATAGVTTFRKPSGGGNGNIIDPQGRLVTCEEVARRVVVQEKDGKIVMLADQFNAKKLNSPNDVAVKSDGTVWFTDPPYGIKPEQKEQPGNYVFQFNPKTQSLKTVATDFDRPNGLCFSPDESRLYVADSGKPHHIRVFEVGKDGILGNSRVFCVIDKGGPDGIRCDVDGRVWSSAGDGVQVFTPKGELIGKILISESPSNLCFGGKDHKTVFITAQTSLYAIEVAVKGK